MTADDAETDAAVGRTIFDASVSSDGCDGPTGGGVGIGSGDPCCGGTGGPCGAGGGGGVCAIAPGAAASSRASTSARTDRFMRAVCRRIHRPSYPFGQLV